MMTLHTMNPPNPGGLPLADAAADLSSWRAMGSRFREGGAQLEPTELLLVAAVIVAVILVLWLLVRLFQLGERRAYRSPWRLFIQLCDAHRLTWRESWLLWRLARAQRLRQPALLFVQPQRLAPPQIPKKFRRRQGVLDDLRQRLFQPLTDSFGDAQ